MIASGFVVSNNERALTIADKEVRPLALDRLGKEATVVYVEQCGVDAHIATVLVHFVRVIRANLSNSRNCKLYW